MALAGVKALSKPVLVPAKRKKPSLDSLVQADIKRLVKLSTFEPQHRYILDTGSPELNAALGGPKGIPYGKLVELRGRPHGGKTTLSLILGGMAQRDGAAMGYIDPEESRDREYTEKFGLDWDQIVKIYPKLITRKNRPPRLESAEELFAEAEVAMGKIAALGIKKQFWLLDSIAMLRTRKAILGSKKEEQKGQLVRDRSMNAMLDRAAFLGEKLPEWTGLAASYNALIILINHEKTKPGVVYGDPTYSPGGTAMQHSCAVRASVRRVKHGRLRVGTQVIGLVGLVSNFKNKSGGGSVQDQKAGFRIRFDRTPARVRFMSEQDAEDLIG